MSHLSTECLAALADQQPTHDESVHLAYCDACSAEVSAYRALLAMAAAERDQIAMPLTRWENIHAALQRDAGLVSASSSRRGSRHLATLGLRVAAGLLLIAGGAMGGRASAGATWFPGGFGADGSADPSTTARGGVDTLSTPFTSVAQAREVRRRAEIDYQTAAAYLAEHDSAATVPGVNSPAAMRARLAALDHVSRTMRDAMRTAPYDPVINGYYLTTEGQREATLRQLNTALPSAVKLTGF